MSERRIWEERLHTSNVPLPRRPWGPAGPIARRQWLADGEPLWPWGLLPGGLAPLEREWEPLQDGQEVVYLHRNSQVRVALVDLASGRILQWRREGLASRWKPSEPRTRDPDQPHQLDRVRQRTRRPPDQGRP